MNNFTFEFTPTESSAGGTLFCIANHLSNKLRPDLNIYKSNKLESTFIEIMTANANIIVGGIYKHFSMDLTDFSINYFNNLFGKVSKKQKKTKFVLGDFNVNLLIMIIIIL